MQLNASLESLVCVHRATRSRLTGSDISESPLREKRRRRTPLKELRLPAQVATCLIPSGLASVNGGGGLEACGGATACCLPASGGENLRAERLLTEEITNRKGSGKCLGMPGNICNIYIYIYVVVICIIILHTV